MSQSPPHIQFRHAALSFHKGALAAVEGIELSIARGESLTILGPSGCGKTTLLRMIAGLARPDQGEVLINGQAPRLGHEAALVFQNFRLLPWETVQGNLEFVLDMPDKAARAARIAQSLETVGLTRFSQHYPHQLSGGMQQRVALARALVVSPQILLMDEPFASLDAQARELMQQETLALMQSSADRPTLVFVTHSVDEALVLGDRVLLMTPRPGRVKQLVDLPFRGGISARRSHPDFAPLRQSLWDALKEMVISDPQSDFYGRLGHKDLS